MSILEENDDYFDGESDDDNIPTVENILMR